MTVGRRHVLGLGALGASAVALDACGALPFAKSSGPAPDVDRVLAELDVVLARLGALEPDVTRFGVKPEHASPTGTDAVKHLLASVCCLGSYRDVPQSTWAEPRVEDRLARTLPFIYETLKKARAHIDGLSDEAIAKIDRKLQRDPDLTMRIMERVDEYAKEVHAPFEQRTYLRTTTAQLAGRFRYEGVKEVTSKISSKFARALASRKSDLGMAPDEDLGGGGGGDQKTQPTPVRVQFRTRATAPDVKTATCSLEPNVATAEGESQPILLDWEDFRCPTTPERSSAPNPIRGAVHHEPRADGDNVVTIVVYPPADSTFDFSPITTDIGRQLKKRLDARLESVVGNACTTSADCAGLHCIQERCATLAGSRAPRVAPADSHLGTTGDSCRKDDDCAEPLTCYHAACDAHEPSSSKLIKTTGHVAKWGAILLIPPICAIGILVLTVCLFMVIVAGFESVGGD